MSAQKPPTGLQETGKKLWRAVVEPFDLDQWELSLLVQVCRCADRLDRLEVDAALGPVTVMNHKGDMVAHPSMVEARQQSIVLARLLAAMRMPSGDEGEISRPQRRQVRGAYGVRALGSVSQSTRRRSS